jgi:hypothetical protein
MICVQKQSSHQESCSALPLLPWVGPHLSHEQVICAVLDKGLKPGLDRYFPYRDMVATWPNPFYVFLGGSAQQVLFVQKAVEQHITYMQFNVAEYVVYEPEQRLAT